ncbi:hypothetical protein [Candidatus Caldatribacterium saccharofermentans]|uniref:hypothetical protein n=1 Tax=Candidatus Caldatribacterium saccharofermentans TaxID=1454753 RepID=UPI003D072288
MRRLENVVKKLLHSLIDACPQQGFIPLEEYAFQEAVKAYLADLSCLDAEDMGALLSETSFLGMLQRATGGYFLQFSHLTLLWLVEIERTLGVLREGLARALDPGEVFIALQE